MWEFIQELILINTEKNPNLEQMLIAWKNDTQLNTFICDFVAVQTIFH